MEEPLVVRPTSETIIATCMRNGSNPTAIFPYLSINGQMWFDGKCAPPFLRTLEFYWQEGHTAHETAEEAEEETLRMLDVYADFAINEAAVPVVKGRKSESERFAGAVRTYSIEGMMKDTRALQSGTSHNLGQNFAKAFNINILTAAMFVNIAGQLRGVSPHALLARSS